jgi:hypothetical protein
LSNSFGLIQTKKNSTRQNVLLALARKKSASHPPPPSRQEYVMIASKICSKLLWYFLTEKSLKTAFIH